MEEENIDNFLLKSKNSVIQAVRIFNDPTFEFRTANFCLLMIIGWTSLIYAIFLKNGKKISFEDKLFTIKIKENEFIVSNKKPLKDCIIEYYKNENNPIRKNLELFIQIRNLIEHQSSKKVDSFLYPELVSLFLNYKKVLFEEFNQTILDGVEIFMPLIINNEKINIQEKQNSNDLIDFIKTYRESLDIDIIKSDEYAFKVFLIPKIINNKNKADLSIEFIKNDNKNHNYLEKIYAIIKEKEINNGLTGKELKAKEIVEEIKKEYKWFTMNDFVKFWRQFKIRPELENQTPNKTNIQYCIYTGVKNMYRYKPCYIDFIKNKIKNGEFYKEELMAKITYTNNKNN